jgi:hypothetical protein
MLEEIIEYLQANNLLSEVDPEVLEKLNQAYADTETRDLAATRDRILTPAGAARILCSMATHTTAGTENGAPTTASLEEIEIKDNLPEPAATPPPPPATTDNKPVNENSLLGIKINGVKAYPGRVSGDRKYKL